MAVGVSEWQHELRPKTHTHAHTPDNISFLMQDFRGNQPREVTGFRKSKRLTRRGTLNGCKQLQGWQIGRQTIEVGPILEIARHLHQEMWCSAEAERRDRLFAPQRTGMPPRKGRLRLKRGGEKTKFKLCNILACGAHLVLSFCPTQPLA